MASAPDRRVARLLAAYEACELSDLARSAVTTGGSLLDDAAQVLRAALRYAEAAAAAARVEGAGWDDIGAALGMAPERARERFAAAEERLRAAADPDPVAGGWWRHHARRDPDELAADLADWVRRNPS
ncbi:hypothetical protein [Pseudonocardia sp. GCM10023141]|uniref:hypothetical protein n=1 Tax=Pseudonocardia sp. GCM10023141 TaxID=3252653 RepID=UPI00361F726C